LKKRGIFDGVLKNSTANTTLEKMYLDIFEINYDHRQAGVSNIDINQNNDTDICLHSSLHSNMDTTFYIVDTFFSLQTNVSTKKNTEESEETINYFKGYESCMNTSPEDSDAWMYMSPEELDKEMEARVTNIDNKESSSTEKKKQEEYLSMNKTSKLTDGGEGNKDDCDENFKAEADQLQTMLSSMKSFMGGKSGTFVDNLCPYLQHALSLIVCTMMMMML
jgi:hypothetical protein